MRDERGKMFLSWLSTILILPFTVIVVIPGLLLWLSGSRYVAPPLACLVAGGVLFWVGLSLAIWTMGLFHVLGKGTAAPWNPPKNLVIWGPYCHVRNPMITSVLIMLTAGAILLRSWEVASWALVFFSVNHFYYFPQVEEPKLLERFGENYADYKKQVPRWIPRLRGYKPGGRDAVE